MSETLYLSYPPRLASLVASVKASFDKAGYVYQDLDQPEDGALVLLFLDMESTPEEIYASALWLKEQFDYSSFKALRLMPFLLYRSSLGDVEEQVDEHLADTLEEVISGEFKPYGYDLDDENPLREFASVLENYEE
jgi:hypothetical protein